MPAPNPARTQPAADRFSVVIADYLRAAEAGRATDGAGNPLSAAGARSLRRALAHVDAVLGATPLDLAGLDDAAVQQLARQVVESAGLEPGRLDAIAGALNGLVAHARSHAPVTPSSWTPPTERTSVPVADADADMHTPTSAMLLLGARSGAMVERAIALAFVLTAIALALALI